jgi:hypothetical protein
MIGFVTNLMKQILTEHEEHQSTSLPITPQVQVADVDHAYALTSELKNEINSYVTSGRVSVMVRAL